MCVWGGGSIISVSCMHKIKCVFVYDLLYQGGKSSEEKSPYFFPLIQMLSQAVLSGSTAACLVN